MTGGNSGDPLTYLIQGAASNLGEAGLDPRAEREALDFQQHDLGPTEIAARITGAVTGGKRRDDGPYFTNNEDIPWHDPVQYIARTLVFPVASGTFLFQK
ncbi:hypothetical protein HOY82DRAFT_649205 [Tuber indicum]|nr:hypothetical protein HOY82DRAFT_649205 [Tuber indicum]